MSTKIHHLRDPKLPARVMTLVSRVEGDKVVYGYSLNRPSRWVGPPYSQSGVREVFLSFIKGDQFNKARGRQIAEGRMNNAPLVADLAGRTPDQAILETLASASENALVRRIAEKALGRIPERTLR